MALESLAEEWSAQFLPFCMSPSFRTRLSLWLLFGVVGIQSHNVQHKEERSEKFILLPACQYMGLGFIRGIVLSIFLPSLLHVPSFLGTDTKICGSFGVVGPNPAACNNRKEGLKKCLLLTDLLYMVHSWDLSILYWYILFKVNPLRRRMMDHRLVAKLTKLWLYLAHFACGLIGKAPDISRDIWVMQVQILSCKN